MSTRKGRHSFDGGTTWSCYLPVIESMGLIFLWDVAVDADDPDLLYYAAGNPGWAWPDQKGLYTVDISTLDPAPGLHADGPGEFLESTAGVGIWRIYAGTLDGVFISSDGGITREQHGVGMPGPEARYGIDVAVSPFDPDLVACGSWYWGLSLSTDGGAHWFHYSENLYPTRVQEIVWDWENPGRR